MKLLNKITVLIPTKDRKEFLNHTLNSCLNTYYDNYEVIVCDDGSTDGSVEMIKSMMKKNPSLKLLTTKNNLGMLENFERGIHNIKEGYVVVLGGDDALMPNFYEKINDIINRTSAQLITWSSPIFTYPNTKMKSGQLVVERKFLNKKKEFFWIEGENFLKSQEKKLSYSNDPFCPMIYVKGIASIDLIKQVQQKSPNQRFYQCSTPDGYSGIVLAGAVKKYLFVNEPLSLFGVSKTSQGLNYINSDKESKRISKEFFDKSKSIKLHKNLGKTDYSPLISVMTADFLYKANEINNIETKIDSKNLIDKALNELCNGHFSSDNIKRELEILRSFSEYTSNLKYFKKKLRKKKRNLKYVFEGFGFSPNVLFFNTDKIKIYNINQAGYFVQNLSKILVLFNFKILMIAAYSSLKYKFFSILKSKKLNEFLLDNN